MVAFLILLLFAIIFLVAGGVMLYFRSKSQQKAGLMSQTETSSASDVPGLRRVRWSRSRGRYAARSPLPVRWPKRPARTTPPR